MRHSVGSQSWTALSNRTATKEAAGPRQVSRQWGQVERKGQTVEVPEICAPSLSGLKLSPGEYCVWEPFF